MTDESTHDLEQLAARARAAVGACASLAAIDELKVELFGKKGSITAQLKSLGTLAPDARREAGARINAVRDEIGGLMAARQAELRAGRTRAQARDRPYRRHPARARAAAGRPAPDQPRAPPHRGTVPQLGLQRRGRSRGRGRLAQLRGAQHPGQSPGPGDARHVLLPRRAPAADAHFARAGTRDAAGEAAAQDDHAGPRVPHAIPT